MTDEEVETRYRNQQSIRAIAELAGTHYGNIRKRLLARGVKLRRRGDPWATTLAPRVKAVAERRANERKLKDRRIRKRRRDRVKLIETVGRLRQAGLTYSEIMDETGKTYNQIAVIVLRHINPTEVS